MADTTIDRGGSAAPAPGIFLRQATGLVRELSTWDAFNIDLTNVNTFANIAILLPLGLVLFAGANLWLSVLLGAIAGMSVVFVYVLLAQAMPRSGGDYVFISRILHPFLGFLGSWCMMLLCAFFSAFNAWSIGNWVLPDFFGPLGAMTGNHRLIDFAVWVSQPAVVNAITVISFALYFAIMYSGAKFAARTQWLPVIFTALALIVGIPTLLFTSGHTYLSNFNSFAAHFHTSAAAMEAVAAKNGTNLNPPFSWGSTIAFWPWVMVIFGYAVNSVMIGGEVRNPRRAQFVSVIASTIIGSAGLIIFFALGVSRIPSQLMAAFGYFGYVNPAKNPIPFTVYAHVPMALASGNPLFLICISGAVAFGLWFASIGLYFWGTRYMFAWALDRIAPPQVGVLVGRQNAPVVALAVLTALGIAFGIMLEQVPNFSYVTGSLLQAFLFLFTCIAAIVFPFRLKRLYSGSIKSEIGGIPWISIFGIWGTAFMVVMVYYFITQSQFGTVTGTALTFSEVSIGVGVVYYIAAWLFARSRGIDLGMTYREIPPE